MISHVCKQVGKLREHYNFKPTFVNFILELTNFPFHDFLCDFLTSRSRQYLLLVA